MLFFAALAAIPLADATALFFVAPLFITLLSIPVLWRERVGVSAAWRPWASALSAFSSCYGPGGGMARVKRRHHWLILLLPVLGAFAYASMQVLTRALGPSSTASAMAVYVQGGFIAVSFAFWLIAGDGRYAEGLENKSADLSAACVDLAYRCDDWPLFVVLGLMSADHWVRLEPGLPIDADATTIAPFDYVALPMSITVGLVGVRPLARCCGS